MRSFFWLLLLGVVLASIALVVRSGIWARKNPGAPINGAMRVALADNSLQWSEQDIELIAKNYNGALDTPSGLRYLIRQPGTGPKPIRGQLVTVHYEGRFLDGEKIFDTSANHPEGPFNFRINVGAVIPGWDEGILDMKKGEKRTLIVPYWLAYGEKGITGKIPRHATLVFDIELLKFE